MNEAFIIILVVITAYSGIKFWIGVIKKVNKETKLLKNVWLHCFNCEIEMPVENYQGEIYCSNCKLIHHNKNYSISEECKHPFRLTKVIQSSATCETTIEFCADCNEPLTKPKTDCV